MKAKNISQMLINAALCAFLAIPAYASSQVGKIVRVIVRDDGLHYFFLEGNRSTKPECAANFDYWMIKDEETAYGKSQFSMLLTAYTTGKTVRIYGSGVCTRWGDGEDIRILELRDESFSG